MSADRGGHGPDAFVLFNLKQLFHGNAARCSNAARVIAQQIHNHAIFCAIFQAVGQTLARTRVPVWVGISRRGAFHGSGTQPGAASVQEQLGREREDLLCAHIDIRSVAGWMVVQCVAINSQGRMLAFDLDGKGMVDLIDIAASEPVFNSADITLIVFP